VGENYDVAKRENGKKASHARHMGGSRLGCNEVGLQSTCAVLAS
jgi:hypothetical protein